MKRREFLISTAGLTGVAAGFPVLAAPRPCPPPTLGVKEGTSTSSNCAAAPGALPVTTLTAGGAPGTHAWTYGQAFREGDVPCATGLIADGADLQMDVRNRWPDGSVKFAVLSGVSNFSGGSTVRISLRTGSPRAGADVPAISAGDVGVTEIAFGDFGKASLDVGAKATYSPRNVGNKKWSAGSIRTVCDWVQSCARSTSIRPRLVTTTWRLCWYVRKYSNGNVEIEFSVENGWVFVPLIRRTRITRRPSQIKGVSVDPSVGQLSSRTTPLVAGILDGTRTRKSLRRPTSHI